MLNIKNQKIDLIYLKYFIIRHEIKREDIHKYIKELYLKKRQFKQLEKSGKLDDIYSEIGDTINQHNLIARKIERLKATLQEVKNSNEKTPNDNERASLISRLIAENQIKLLSLEVSRDLTKIGAPKKNQSEQISSSLKNL